MAPTNSTAARACASIDCSHGICTEAMIRNARDAITSGVTHPDGRPRGWDPRSGDCRVREVTSRWTASSRDGRDGARSDAIEGCCIGVGNDSHALFDDNCDAFTCIETMTDEGHAPPRPSRPRRRATGSDPGLAPPPI